MDKYIKDLLYVIRNGSMENTYKMSWCKSIVESCYMNPKEKIISFERLSRYIFKYYWDQTIYFDLQQSPNSNKPPEIISYVKEVILKYQSKYGKKPVKFIKVENKIDIDINRIVKTLKQDVCWRFLIVNGSEYQLYKLDKRNSTISIPNPQIIKEYYDVLFESINFRWTQKLEDFNSSPRISKKVRIIDIEDVKRGNLGKFRVYLDKLGRDCFICNKIIDNETPSIDHLIPWSYMYSDDLWNLVYTHKSCNSSKFDKLVSEGDIEKVEKRNKLLFKILNSENFKDKHMEELKLSIDRNFPKKFWIGFK